MARADDSDYARAIRSSNSAPIGRGFIALDTLGKLRAHHYRMAGNCLPCAGLYRADVPASARVSSSFDIDLDALVRERGEDSPVAGMAPVPCPRCGSRETSVIMLPPRRFR